MLPLNRSQIPQLYKTAMAQQQAGRLEEATKTYHNILRISASLPEVHFQLGRIALLREDFAESFERLEKALELKPQEPAIWQVMSQAVVSQGDQSRINALQNRVFRAPLPEKVKSNLVQMLDSRGRKSAVDTGKIPRAQVDQALRLMNASRFAEAERLAGSLLQIDPDVSLVLTILANARAAQGKAEAAEASYRQAVAAGKTYAEAHCYYGQFLVSHGRNSEAREHLNRALTLAPRMPQAWLNMALMHANQGQFTKALAAAKKCLDELPNEPNGLLIAGKSLVAQGEYKMALPYLEKRAAINPPDPEAQVSLGTAYSGLHRSEEAAALFDKVTKKHPNLASGQFAKATFEQSFGRFDVANPYYRKAVELAPDVGVYRYSLARNRKVAPDDPMIEDLKESFAYPLLAPMHRIYIGYALAKVMEDIKDYGSVFKYLRPAAEMMQQLHPYDEMHARAHIEAMKQSCGGFDFAGRHAKGVSDFAPILVTGLPRSGTTLVEQILASHSQVVGAGELGFAQRKWRALLEPSGGPVRRIADVSDKEIAKVGSEIEREMRAIAPDAQHITDKSVLSYESIGPIKLCLPNAKFVIVNRDPRDCLLSMYKNLFIFGRHTYSYSLTDLARHYRLYQEILEFWRKAAPDWFYEIQYEELIADPEVETRKLLDACGLEFEEACLAFHETERRVTTLSLNQVRQPIYASSLQAWRRYEADLAEMLDELGGEYAPGAQ